MKTLLRHSLLAAAALALGCSNSDSPPGSAPATDSGRPTVMDSGSGGDGGASEAAAEAGALPTRSIDPFSVAPGSAHEHEPFIAVSPQGRVAVSFLSFLTGDAGITVGYRISNDAGSTWGSATLFPMPSGDNTQANASVAAGDDGTLYMAWAAENHTLQGRSGLHVFVATSAPGTTTFSAPVEVSGPASTAALYDQPRVMVTHSGAVNVGYLSVAADGLSSTMVDARSTDGKTWVRTTIAGPGSYGSFRDEARFCRPAATGRIFMVYVDTDVATYYYDYALALRHSDDDGATWSDPVAVTSAQDELIVDASANIGCVTRGNNVWLYYGLSPEQSYLIGEVGGSSEYEPTMTQVRLAHSGDGGGTIDRRASVGDPAAGSRIMYPVLTGEEGSTLDLAYYAGHGDNDALGQLRRSRATDGATFPPSALVHAPVTLEIDREAPQWVGDYIGAAYLGGDLFLVYDDNSTATPHVGFTRMPSALPTATTEPDAGSAPQSPDAGCYAATPFTPLAWAPPTAFGQGACTPTQVSAYLSCSATGDCSSFRADGPNASCLACLETDVGASAHGPFVTQSGDGGVAVVETNYGGCQAHFDGQTGSSGCGAQANASNDCVNQECGACPDFTNPQQTGPTTECYSVSNDVGVCSAYRETTGCGVETYSGDSGATQCTDPSTFVSLWCGG